ncbi:hypothetical protein C8R44DRAFT_985525 [Mycena epipterygia]|nr:hypothetical protein C8R44DRAFT_985525 [Mycena epipterygia]
MSIASAEIPEEGAIFPMPAAGKVAPPEASEPPKRGKYYIDDPMSIFLVGNQLFKVHRHFLVTESEVFRWMFACPPGGSDPDGFCDERAIPLPGVACVEFEALLDFFYTEKFQRHQAVMKEWIDLLAISTRFDFQRIREDAINAIEHSRWKQPRQWPRRITIDPIEQIVLAERHDIPHWLPVAYALICERSKPLDEWEAEKIGYRKTALLARAREAVRNSNYVPSPLPLEGKAEPFEFEEFEVPLAESPTSNGFFDNRDRVDAIVSEVFFPAAEATIYSN